MARETLRSRYGVPVNWFCYPSGHYDASVVEAVEAGGLRRLDDGEPGLGEPDGKPLPPAPPADPRRDEPERAAGADRSLAGRTRIALGIHVSRMGPCPRAVPALHSNDPLIVRVEIPKGTRNKYEWDEELDAIVLDRLLFSLGELSRPTTASSRTRGPRTATRSTRW